jgi:3-phenylpropionate/trans-cinnamate dioxygenase ferredoxin reductase subunit
VALTFYVFWLIDNRLMAGIHVNRWDEGIGPVQDLIRRGRPIDRHRLVDLAVPLTDTTRI